MQTWICRILTVVFFLNTLPTEVWAGKGLNQAQTEGVVEEKIQTRPYLAKDYWKDYESAVREELKRNDLSADETEYLKYELQKAHDQYEFAKKHASNKVHARDKAIDEKYSRLQLPIERIMTVKEMYRKARSSSWTGVAISLLHNKAFSAKLAKNDLHQMSKQYQLSNPAAPVSTTYVAPTPSFNVPQVSTNEAFLQKLASNEISYEDILDYMDPISSSSNENTQDAIKFLSSILITYLTDTTPIGSDEKANVIWTVTRIKMRALHQLYVLSQGSEQTRMKALSTRASLLTLYTLGCQFLKKQGVNDEAEHAKDRQEYEADAFESINEEIAQAIADYNTWRHLDQLSKSVLNDTKQKIESEPASQATLNGISALTTYFFYNGQSFNTLLAMINKDGKSFFGEHSQLVTEFFTTLADCLVDMPSTLDQQKNVKSLLLNATFINKNAINVRVQALALASVLVQAENGKLQQDGPSAHTLKNGIFSQIDFREEMALRAAQIYATTTEWNGHWDNGANGMVVNETYGIDTGSVTSKYPWWDIRYFWDAHMDSDNLQELSNHLAAIYETFLPLPAPSVKPLEKHTEGMYKGCWKSRVATNQKRTLSTLTAQKGLKAVKHPVDADGKVLNNIWCQFDKYGEIDNTIVWATNADNPNQKIAIGMRKNNPRNMNTTNKEYIKAFALEVLTWYLWGKALQALKRLWQLGRTFAIASKASVHAAKGMRLARFNGKFSQIWKYYGEGWKTQAGIAEIVGKRQCTVTLARGGKLAQFEVDLGGRSVSSLAGRVQLRIEARRQLLRIGADKTGQSIVKNSVKETSAKTIINGATGKAVTQQPKHFAGKATADKLGKEGAKLITDDTHFNIKKWLSDLTPEEQTAFKEWQTMYNTTVRTYGKRTLFGRYNKARANTVKIKTPQGTAKEIHFSAQDGIFIDPKLGLPAHAYGTTIYAATADEAAFLYNAVARDIMAGKIPTKFSFAYHYLGQLPGVQYTMGTVKFAAFLQVFDPMAYDVMNKYDELKHEKYVKQFKIRDMADDEKKAVKEEITKDILKQIQSMENVDKRGATISAAFMFFNEALDKGLNYIGADGVIQFRRDMYEVVDQVIEKLDKPFKKLTGEEREWFPYPAQVALVNILLATDPTTPEAQETKIYREMRHSQDYQDAKDARTVTVFQEKITDQIDLSRKALNDYMKGDLTADFIKALPGTKQNINALYDQYADKLSNISQQAGQTSPTASKLQKEKALENAQNAMDTASKEYLQKRGEYMAAAIKRYMANDKQETLKAQKEIFEDDFNLGVKVENSRINRDDEGTAPISKAVASGETPTFFDIKDYDEMKEKLDEYYAQRQALYVQLHKLLGDNFNKSDKEIDTIKNNIDAKIEAVNEKVRTDIDVIRERCSGRRLKYDIEIEIWERTHKQNEEEKDLVQNSLDAFMQNIWNVPFIVMLPKKKDSIQELYDAYIKDLNNARKKAVKNSQEAQTVYQSARHNFFAKKKSLMQQGVKALVAYERQATEEAFQVVPEPQLNQLKKLNNAHWKKVEALWTHHYELYYQTELLLNKTAKDKADLERIKQAVLHNQQKMARALETYYSYCHDFKAERDKILRPRLQLAY